MISVATLYTDHLNIIQFFTLNNSNNYHIYICTGMQQLLIKLTYIDRPYRIKMQFRKYLLFFFYIEKENRLASQTFMQFLHTYILHMQPNISFQN